jgi:hypothetical protein
MLNAGLQQYEQSPLLYSRGTAFGFAATIANQLNHHAQCRITAELIKDTPRSQALQIFGSWELEALRLSGSKAPGMFFAHSGIDAAAYSAPAP